MTGATTPSIDAINRHDSNTADGVATSVWTADDGALKPTYDTSSRITYGNCLRLIYGGFWLAYGRLIYSCSSINKLARNLPLK